MKDTDSTMRAALNIWKGILPSVGTLLGKPVRLVFPGSSDPYYQWFQDLELGAFRSELRYSPKELDDRMEYNNLLFFFIVSDSGREAVVLAYDDLDNPDDALYLDTIAVKTTGKGLGKLLMENLMEYAKIRGYGRIKLDTEYANEKGQELVRFYKRLGFFETASTEDGNISMELELTD